MVDPFKTPKLEVPPEMRDMANKSVEQAKRAFDSFMGATHQAAGTIENSTQTIQDSARTATRQMVEYAEQNVKAAFDHAQALVQAGGLEDVMKLQTEFMRTQMAALQDQMKSMGATAQSMGKTAQEQVAAMGKTAQSAAQNATREAQQAMTPKR